MIQPYLIIYFSIADFSSGSRDTVDETALILGQFVSGNRKLSRTETDRHSDKQTLQAKNLLLMTKLPPELTISNRLSVDENSFSKFSGKIGFRGIVKFARMKTYPKFRIYLFYSFNQD